ncbi:MAG TPA: hypothetical protein PKK82_03265, partial [Anaerolineaceae bacterium]|nr:hypothetical protein [Anaerolineaceae bacterium]
MGERERNSYGLVEDNPIILAAVQAVRAIVLMVVEIVRLAGVLNGWSFRTEDCLEWQFHKSHRWKAQ